MSNKKEALWQIILHAEHYLLHDGWLSANEPSYAQRQASAQKNQQVSSSYSFLQSVEKIPLSQSTPVVEPNLASTNEDAPIGFDLDDNWSRLVEDVARLHFYTLPEKKESAQLMMIFSYAENKFTEIQEYAQKWLDAIGISSADVYFTSVYKTHHPVGKVVLSKNEAMILAREVRLIQPQFLLVTGRLAYEALFEKRQSISKSRMSRHDYNGIPAVITYDPELVLQYPILRRDVWRDLQKLKEIIAKKETSAKEVSN